MLETTFHKLLVFFWFIAQSQTVSIFIVASIFMFAVSKDKTAPSSMY